MCLSGDALALRRLLATWGAQRIFDFVRRESNKGLITDDKGSHSRPDAGGWPCRWGCRRPWGISLNGPQIAHQGYGDGAPTCTTRHGGQFQGDAALKAPALAGLSRAFILSRLAHYAGPDGHNASMRQVATALSLGERGAVAA